MRKVIFTECCDEQVNYGGHDDPRKHLKIGETYTLVRKDAQSWKTNYFLEGFEEYGFNSVCFRDVKTSTLKAQYIVDALEARKGFEFGDLDEEILNEIVEEIAGIIEQPAHKL